MRRIALSPLAWQPTESDQAKFYFVQDIQIYVLLRCGIE